MREMETFQSPSGCCRLWRQRDESSISTASYNMVMMAHAQSGNRDAADKAEQILQKMIQLRDSGSSRIRPDRKSYGIVISAFAKSRDPNAGKKAEAVLATNANTL